MHHRSKHHRRGLSLLELVIVTVIIGVLASIAVPSFHRALEQTRTDIAAANLRAIWSAQRLYWLDNRAYAPDLATLQSLDLVDASVSNQQFFTYEIEAASASGFSVWATRVANSAWNGTLSIDQTGQVSGVLSAYGEGNIVPSY
ncbi:MAG TPA: prepilin-type N-terminal cleavage/methylation domain-containing protein [Pirellulales bacterium]|jgi:type IV pilus assembly protein PilE|nr:prepilin-type N-terminal cleavage/methylation domain-containing protein [Pirellulales bacterium]